MSSGTIHAALSLLVNSPLNAFCKMDFLSSSKEDFLFSLLAFNELSSFSKASSFATISFCSEISTKGNLAFL